MKSLIIVVLATLAFAAHAELIKGYPGVKRSMKDPRAVKFGGFLERQSNGKGVHVVNTQKRIAPEKFRKSIVLLAHETRVNFTFDPASKPVTVQTANSTMASLSALAAIFIVDDASLHVPMLVSPECHWAIVNAAALGEGSESPAFIEARMRKMIIRAFFYACGGATTDYGSNLMATIKKVSDLDEYADDAIPQDIVGRAGNAMHKIGIEQNAYVPYLQACKEGWAPAPTNEMQKAAWDKVHSIPEKPIKISFDKDKQKPVVK